MPMARFHPMYLLPAQFAVVDPVAGVVMVKKHEIYVAAFGGHLYRPERNCGQGNIFTSMCLSTGDVSASVHVGIYIPIPGTPPRPGTS